jgi:hypothetical protein
MDGERAYELRAKPTGALRRKGRSVVMAVTVRSANLMARTQFHSIAPVFGSSDPFRSCLGFADRARWRPIAMTPTLPPRNPRTRALGRTHARSEGVALEFEKARHDRGGRKNAVADPR